MPAGQLRSPDLKRVQIAGRALVYGFARMNIDGHFPRWGVAGAEAERTAEGDPRSLHRRASPASRAGADPGARGCDASGIHLSLKSRRQIHCVFMTIPLRFYDTIQVPAASCVSWSSPAKAFALRRVVLRPIHGARAKSRSVRTHRCRPRRCRDRHLAAACGGDAASGGARHHGPHRNRFRLAHRLPAGLGHPQFLLHHTAAPAGAVGRAVADAGRGAGAAVEVQARRRADDRELHRPDGDRSRHRGVPVHDLPEPALVGDRAPASSPFH